MIFENARIQERIRGLSARPAVLTPPLVRFLERLGEERTVLERRGANTAALDSLRSDLLDALEEAQEYGWKTPAQVGEILGVHAETVRGWVRSGKVEFVQGSNGYLVDLGSAMKLRPVVR